ncbi:MAG: Ribosomal RNA large subunit methyltransferase Cfr [Parcubacteria group bacterium ADurb.Bin316]|nr:MAG: Ribosomal RNA large subunit methyltransferase Cfr [Parcubacteria group bacterium ADurb.Bin316]HOZ55987.1 23S rRNA (adenine(2503)-C(2))-methyltransferase RlmN [bacterium]
MKIKELEKFIAANNLPKYRLQQIVKAIYQEGVILWQEISTLPKDLRVELEKRIEILSCQPIRMLKADNKSSFKALLKAGDGCVFETVLMRNKPGRWTACISCQVGCPIGCVFCATGQGGFKRNLESEEINDQILLWLNYIKNNFPKEKLNSIVYMGMGEPFLNWENVKESIKELTNPELFGFGDRSISVSTIGIVDGFKKLAKDFPQVNLAVSLHCANNDKRSELVPINDQYNLTKLRQAINQYISLTNRKVFLEYVMLADINDTKEDSGYLVEYVKSFDKPYLLHINLIPYNETKGKFKMTSQEKADRFKNYLAKNKISVTIRRSLGREIKGACGQLAGE